MAPQQQHSSLLHFITIIAVAGVVAMATAYERCKTITTFNTALKPSTVLPGFEKSETRLLRIIQALKRSQADVICLQEVWFEKDLDDILTGLRSKYPHHFSQIHLVNNLLRIKDAHCFGDERNRVKDTPCIQGDFKSLVNGLDSCVECSRQLRGISQLQCIVSTCPQMLRHPSTNPQCLTCVFFYLKVKSSESADSATAGATSTSFSSNSYSYSFAEALIKCSTTKSGESDNRFNPSGLAILSREQLITSSYSPFFPTNRTMIERGYIEATLRDGKRIICTQLSSTIMFSSSTPFYFEYDLPSFTSYEQQQRAEVEILKNKLTVTTKNGVGVVADHILAGDIGMGPRNIRQKLPEKKLVGLHADNYKFLVGTLGYVISPYFKQDGRCTVCHEDDKKDHVMTTVAAADGQHNDVIDVVIVSSASSSFVVPSISRVFHATEDFNHLTSDPPLSDHFGVQALVCEK